MRGWWFKAPQFHEGFKAPDTCNGRGVLEEFKVLRLHVVDETIINGIKDPKTTKLNDESHHLPKIDMRLCCPV